MVSRSIEKMLLIAIGLSTAVIVGVPVLLYSIQTINNISELEVTKSIAGQILNATDLVDSGKITETLFQVNVPTGFGIEASGSSLSVYLNMNGSNTYSWSRSYNHTIALTSPQGKGLHIVSIQMDKNVIVIKFSDV